MASAVIRWTNKNSGEEGFVSGVAFKDGHIFATKLLSEARVYPNVGVAKGMITKLIRENIGTQNDYVTEEIQ